MAVSKTKEWRMQAAKLAKAYMAGGDAPYQAARKTGFMRVGIMEEAIKELEKEERTAEEAYEQAPVEQRAEVPEEQKRDETQLVLRGEFENQAFCVREYEPNAENDGMVRIWSGKRPHFIYANVNRVPMLIDLLKEVMAGKELKPGADEKEAQIRELEKQVFRLQEQLVNAMDAMPVAELQAANEKLAEELEKERALNRRLRDKIVDMILEH